MSDVQTTSTPSGDAASNNPNRVNEGVLLHFRTIWIVLHPGQLSQPLKGTVTGEEEEFSSSLGNNEENLLQGSDSSTFAVRTLLEYSTKHRRIDS